MKNKRVVLVSELCFLELAPAYWEPHLAAPLIAAVPAVKRFIVLPDHTRVRFCLCSLRSFLAMNMSWCPAVWVSGGLFYGGTQVFSPNFSFIVITKIPLMVKYSMIFQPSNLLITLGF